MNNMNPIELFRKKFAMYKKIMDESGKQKAWDTLFQGYPERQKKNMGPFIENTTLAEGTAKLQKTAGTLGNGDRQQRFTPLTNLGALCNMA